MLAMQLQKQHSTLLQVDLPAPQPAAGEVLIKVTACGVCRTDLHVIDAELPEPRLPLVLGHEIVGRIEQLGADVVGLQIGQRVGVPWLAWTCGVCYYCKDGQENLCDNALFTGYTRDGGYAQYAAADSRYTFPLPDRYDDVSAAPFLCAGLIGWRSYRMCGNAERIGLYGFGAAAHIIAQIAISDGRQVFGFTRDGDTQGQDFARSLGAVWAGGSSATPPQELDAAIIFAPAGPLVPQALRSVRKGGVVVCGGIHMSDIPQFPYETLWGERSVRSVANLTREDGMTFFEKLKVCDVATVAHPYPLESANKALSDLRQGNFEGAAVLVPPQH